MAAIAPRAGRLKQREVINLLAEWGTYYDLADFLNHWVGAYVIEPCCCVGSEPEGLRASLLSEPWACPAAVPLIEALVARYAEWWVRDRLEEGEEWNAKNSALYGAIERAEARGEKHWHRDHDFL